MCDTGRNHNSATCTIAAVLLTRIVACLRNGATYELRGIDRTRITEAQGQAIVVQRYQIPAEIRDARRSIAKTRSDTRRDERVKQGVAKALRDTARPTRSMNTPDTLDNG
jgi:hypothetical protein